MISLMWIKCCICMNESTNYTIDCGHSFCKLCIITWCKTSLTCPICKQSIKPFKIHIIKKVTNMDLCLMLKRKQLCLKNN
jgi:hypothetical protein